MFLVVSHLVLAGTLLAADENVQFQKDGPNRYKQVRTGTLDMVPHPKVVIKAAGHVVVRGSNENKIGFQLVQRVRARTEVDAHRLLGAFRVDFARPRNELVFQYVDAESELSVSVPRQMVATFIGTDKGNVEAFDLDGNVQCQTNGGLIRCDRIKGVVFGDTGMGEIRLGRVGAAKCNSGGGSIFAESIGGPAQCMTRGGEITIREVIGPLELNTGGGNIQVDHAKSTVEAHSGEGVIEIIEAGGAVVADTRGGSIQVGSARGVKCDNAQGTVRLKTGSGPLQVSTAIGNILAELLPGTRFDNALLSAGSGDITVLIPSNLPISIFARNDSGGTPRIYSDFPSIQTKNIGFVRPPLLAEGAINGGGPVLRVAVSSGVIFLKKAR